MIKNLITYFTYKRRLRLLKIILVNHVMNIVVNNNDFVIGFERLLIALANNDNSNEYGQILKDYFQTIKSTNTVNNTLNKNK